MKVVGTVSGKHGIRDIVIERLVARMGGKVLQGQSTQVPADTDIYLTWRFNLCPDFQKNIADGMMMVCIDLGYFDATKYERFSVCINGVHGNSTPVESIKDLPARPHPPLQPWRPEGAGEFIQLQAAGWIHNPTLRAAASNLPDGWEVAAAQKAVRTWGKEVKIRWHPKNLPPHITIIPPPLAETYDETFVTVTYGSHASIQSIIAGVPGVVAAKRCMAYPVASNDYTIQRPDREAWIHDLSHREYAMMEDSELDAAIEYILRGYEQLQCSV